LRKFSITTSAELSILRPISCPEGCLKSTAMPRLLRFIIM